MTITPPGTGFLPERILAVGGGKGGVGKTVLSIGLAMALARRGKRVVLVDLDLGSGNLHTYMGMHEDRAGVADFLLGREKNLEPLVQHTPVPGVRLISGARFYPGIANPSHQTKLKLIRHIRKLNADLVILDLGAGIHFNTLDFFSISRPGLITVAPEPGSVLNAYSFIKSGLFRHLMRVFSRHGRVREFLEENRTLDEGASEEDPTFSIEWFLDSISAIDPSLTSLVEEVVGSITPALIMNGVTDLVSAVYADNLQKLVLKRLGMRVHYLGNLPRVEKLSHYLVGLPDFLDSQDGSGFLSAADDLVRDLDQTYPTEEALRKDLGNGNTGRTLKEDFLEEEIELISELLETLPPATFSKAQKMAWKLRLYYKPREVVRFLLQRGVESPLFFEP